MFKPTYLYIKQHSITKKCYFGKTSKKDPYKYLGSGTYWKAHLRVHGKQYVETLWAKLFIEEEECNKIAILFSTQQDIVNSDRWLNLIPESGTQGGLPIGFKHTAETKLKIASSLIGREVTKETRIKISAVQKGRTHSISHVVNQANSLRGRKKPAEIVEKTASKLRGRKKGPLSESHRKAVSEAHTGKIFNKVQCPHCLKLVGENVAKQSHFSKCFSLTGVKISKSCQSIIQCPWCPIAGYKGNMNRWHFSNCKYKPQ